MVVVQRMDWVGQGYWKRIWKLGKLGLERRLMKAAGLQELMGQKTDEGHIIDSDKADADDEFFVIQ